MRIAARHSRLSASTPPCSPRCSISSSARSRWERATPYPDARHFVIEQGGEAVGRLTTAASGAGESRALHVIAIVVRASARGRGIGTDVMKRLDDAARAQGATRLTLSVLRSNVHARRLYERLGFRTVADDGASSHMAMVKPSA